VEARIRGSIQVVYYGCIFLLKILYRAQPARSAMVAAGEDAGMSWNPATPRRSLRVGPTVED
jgi:hypothetical protein